MERFVTAPAQMFFSASQNFLRHTGQYFLGAASYFLRQSGQLFLDASQTFLRQTGQLLLDASTSCLRQCGQLFLDASQSFMRQCGELSRDGAQNIINGVSVVFPNTVGEIPYVAETISKMTGYVFLFFGLCCFLGRPMYFLFSVFWVLETLVVHAKVIASHKCDVMKETV